MSAGFDGSAAYLVNASAPITAVPFTVGLWAMFTTSGTNATLWSLSDTGSTDDWFYINKGTDDKVNIGSQQASGSANAGTVSTADTVNTWFYVIARFISSTSRRISVLHNGGLIENAINATSTVPTSIDRVSVGALDRLGGAVTFWPGLIAEYWLANADIQAAGGQLDSGILRQLACRGPFSYPPLIPNLVEYHSFRKTLPPILTPEDAYSGTLGPQTWVNSGAVAPGRAHPPLPYEYYRPRPVSRTLPI